MIEIESVEKVFNQGKANEVKALEKTDIIIKDSEFLVVVGANGSGKSTLLNAISGSILPSKGAIFINGENVTSLPEYKRSRWIARVFQNPLSGTAPDLSILDNFRLASLRTAYKGLSIGINNSFKKKVQDKIAVLGMGLENKINQPMGTLSGGQRQALTLLMSIMDDLKILLLDEPTAALDPRSVDLVMKTADHLIKQYNLTALLVTHNLKDALQYGNRIIMMAEGKVIKDMAEADKTGLKISEMYDWFV